MKLKILLILTISTINFTFASANEMIIECKYMTSLSYQEDGVFGDCDTAEVHNITDQYKYILKQQELSKSYVCIVTNFPSIQEPDIHIQETVGIYCTGMLNLDVKGIVFDCRNGIMKRNSMKFIPIGLGSFFPHLEFIRISHCGLTRVDVTDLKPFENLKRLQVDGNALQKTDFDLFQYNLKLTDLNLASNDISLVEIDAFKGLKLKSLDVSGNVCIRKQLKSINETMQQIKDNCSSERHSATYNKVFEVFWTILITTTVYMTIIGAYVGVMRFKYQKKIRIEFFNELMDNCE